MACFILQENNTMFIHIPKTGGSALHSELQNQNKVALTIPGHLSVKSMHIARGIEVFSIVRNPYERMKSIYRHYYVKDLENTSNKTFEQFVIGVKNSFKSDGLPMNDLPHVKSQSYWVCDSSGNVNIDTVLKYESYDREVIEFLNKKNIDITFIPKERVGDRNIKAELNDNIKEIIYEIYQSDFINFNYNK